MNENQSLRLLLDPQKPVNRQLTTHPERYSGLHHPRPTMCVPISVTREEGDEKLPDYCKMARNVSSPNANTNASTLALQDKDFRSTDVRQSGRGPRAYGNTQLRLNDKLRGERMFIVRCWSQA